MNSGGAFFHQAIRLREEHPEERLGRVYRSSVRSGLLEAEGTPRVFETRRRLANCREHNELTEVERLSRRESWPAVFAGAEFGSSTAVGA